MSDLQSKTPICKANTYAASTGDADDYSPDFVPLEIAEKLELAANGLREHIENTPCWTNAALREKRKVCRAFDALRNAALQPSPHDAPRTETHQANE